MRIPYVYQIDGNGHRQWYSDSVVWKHAEQSHAGGEWFDIPHWNSSITGWIVDGTTWIETEIIPLDEEGVIGEVSLDPDRQSTVRIPVPLAGFLPTLCVADTFDRRPKTVEPDTHAGHPKRERARAVAEEVSACYRMIGGTLHTSSFDVVVGTQARTMRAHHGIALRDIHGLWRHPMLSNRSLRGMSKGPFVPLTAMIEDPGIIAVPPSRLPFDVDELGMFGAFRNASIRFPEAESTCYEYMQRTLKAVSVVMLGKRPIEASTRAAITEARRIVADFEDWRLPVPDALVASSALTDLLELSAAEESWFGHYMGGTDHELPDIRQSFSRWYERRGRDLVGDDLKLQTSSDVDDDVLSMGM